MLGIFLLYFIGKAFFKLSQAYGKNRWVFAFVGIISYYGGTFVAGIAIVLFYELILEQNSDELGDMEINLMALPIGIATCYLTYRLLLHSWKSQLYDLEDGSESELLDA